MGAHRKKMKPYHPRKTHHARVVEKQQLVDLEKKLSMDIGQFLVLSEEGNASQTDHARQKARTDLIKYGPDMQKLAQQIGGPFPRYVDNFLDSVDDLLHTAMIDPAKISLLYHSTQQLEDELS